VDFNRRALLGRIGSAVIKGEMKGQEQTSGKWAEKEVGLKMEKELIFFLFIFRIIFSVKRII
jgi:hypothetical protein